MSFEQFFTKEQFQFFIDKEDGTEQQAKYWQIMNGEFSEAFKSFLKEKQLKGTAGFESMDLQLLSSWNRFVKNEETEEDWAEINKFFAHPIIYQALFKINQIDGEISKVKDKIIKSGNEMPADFDEKTNQDLDKCINENYQKVIEAFNTGNFPGNKSLEEDLCDKTKQTIRYNVEDWEFKPYGLKDGIVVDVIIPEQASIKVNKINLETGNLIITDKIRIKEFLDIINMDSISVNTATDSENETLRCAKDFNFIEVCLDYGQTFIYEKDGLLIAGNTDNTDYTQHGDVCAYVHTMMIIEKENLINIIAERNEEAVEIVNEYLKEDGVRQITVEPGEYYCYSSGDMETTENLISDYEHPFTDVENPVFIFSNRELELVEDLSPSM